jgi:hypothetical protein
MKMREPLVGAANANYCPVTGVLLNVLLYS